MKLYGDLYVLKLAELCIYIHKRTPRTTEKLDGKLRLPCDHQSHHLFVSLIQALSHRNPTNTHTQLHRN